jgi:hypothetical protein
VISFRPDGLTAPHRPRFHAISLARLYLISGRIGSTSWFPFDPVWATKKKNINNTTKERKNNIITRLSAQEKKETSLLVSGLDYLASSSLDWSISFDNKKKKHLHSFF